MQRKRHAALAALAALLVVAVVAGGVWSLRGFRARTSPEAQIPAAGVVLTASHADSAGIDPTTSFRLASAKPLTLKEVREQLTVTPAVELGYEQNDRESKLITIKPVKPLDPNKVYSFRLAPAAGSATARPGAQAAAPRPYQWSFQTRAAFRVLGSLPRSQATGVPLDTGIELTFSHENYGDLAGFFSIAPKVDGRFERHKKTSAFVPQEKLQPGTVYTVTLKPGLPLEGSDTKLDQEFRFAFETAPADQSDKNAKVYLSVGRDVQDFPIGETPYFPVQYYGQSASNQAPVSVAVYRYTDAAPFIEALKNADKVPWWADYSAGRFREPTGGLSRVARFETALKPMPGYGSPYLFLPEPLPAGYYLAEMTVADQMRQVRFQVTDLAAHLTVTSTKSLIWINDVSTRGPVPGAEVSHPGGKASTGADGLALFETPSALGESAGLYLQVRAGSKESVVAVRPGGYTIYPGGPMSVPSMPAGRGRMPYPGPMQPTGLPGYWKYLYLDRPLYKPDDTVKLFGVLQPRAPGAATVGQVTAAILRREYRWLGYGSNPPPLVRAALPVTDGAFSGSLALPNLEPGYYELQVRSGDEQVMSRWFEVQAYTKPAYRMTATSDRRAVFAGERITFKAESTFFEGTPVPNLALNYSISWNGGGQGRLTTGADGTAAIFFTPGAQEQGGNYGGPGYANFNLWASLPEAGEISTSTGVQVFSRNVALRPDVDVTEGAAVIKARVNQITLDKINAGTDSDYIGAPAAGLRVQGTLIEQNWVREEDGEYYDFIAKKVVKQYRYRPAPSEMGSFTAITDADGQIAHRMPINPDKSYQVKLQVLDTNGRVVAQDWGFSGSQYQFQSRGGYGPNKYYRLAAVDGKQQTWALGEQVALRLLENDAPVADRTNGFLFYQARMGLQAYTVQETATYRFPFADGDVPNTNVQGVYFDGRQYQEAQEFPVRFDAKQRELKVTVTPDRSVYRPGESVTLTVQVTDPAGRPVRAQVNLNLVDEALFALKNQEANILAELYGEHVPSGIRRTRQTGPSDLMKPTDGAQRQSATAAPSPAPSAGSTAKMVAAEESAPRRDFRDASYFGTVATAANGRATTSFKLPDNLTTWRMTYQAFAPGIAGAATGTAPVAVKIPFFVDAVFSDTYLTGDRPAITVRSFGADLADGQSVDYTVTVTGPSGRRQTATATGKAFAPVILPIDKLTGGTYTVQVQGAGAGGLQDTLEKQFTVIDSYLLQHRVDYQVLGAQTQMAGPASGLVAMIFTDHQRGRYLQLLNPMRYSGGERLEQKLARSVATDLLKTYFGADEQQPEPEWNPQAFQAPDGSIAILPYSDGDLDLSALAADVAGDRFDRQALAEYFYQVVDDPKTGRERSITALYGLAALGEPVLQQVRALMPAKDLSPSEQLRLAMAAAALGDLEGTRPVYQALMARYGEQLGSNTRLNLGRDQDEILGSTALAAALAARLGEPEAPALLGYLLENPAKEVVLLLQELLAARAALPQLPVEPASFTYLDGGQEKTQEIKPGESVRWTVTAAQLTSMQFKPKQGQVGVSAAYTAPMTAAELQQEPGYAVERTYSIEGKGAGTAWQQGDLVRVTLTYRIPETAPGGGFAITDYLPSGLRLVERPYQRGINYKSGPGPAWPMAVNGRRVTFWAWQKGDPIYYYARVVSPGEYTAEQPVLQHQQSGGLYGHGERAQVRIEG